MYIQEGSWTTKCEMDWLERIGRTHTEVRNRTSKKELLRRYIKAFPQRKNWVGMDDAKIFLFAVQLEAKTL